MNDWSTKKQTVIKVGVLVGLFIGAVYIFTGNSSSLLGGASDYRPHSTATNTSVSCSGATSTQIVAASVSRNAFLLTASSTGDITLCRTGSGCTSGNGLIIEADEFFEQNDEYEGAYSCIGQSNTTTTVHVIHSQ